MASEPRMIDRKAGARSTEGLLNIVVFGVGFGGLSFFKRFPPGPARITLVDRQNRHRFHPLLYQVAAAGQAATDIAQPIRSILSGKPGLIAFASAGAGITGPTRP
ncbi:MAG: hypothetical protein ACREFX_14810 [Opitutaceae bacterium]